MRATMIPDKYGGRRRRRDGDRLADGLARRTACARRFQRLILH